MGRMPPSPTTQYIDITFHLTCSHYAHATTNHRTPHHTRHLSHPHRHTPTHHHQTKFPNPLHSGSRTREVGVLFVIVIVNGNRNGRGIRLFKAVGPLVQSAAEKWLNLSMSWLHQRAPACVTRRVPYGMELAELDTCSGMHRIASGCTEKMYLSPGDRIGNNHQDFTRGTCRPIVLLSVAATVPLSRTRLRVVSGDSGDCFGPYTLSVISLISRW